MGYMSQTNKREKQETNWVKRTKKTKEGLKNASRGYPASLDFVEIVLVQSLSTGHDAASKRDFVHPHIEQPNL